MNNHCNIYCNAKIFLSITLSILFIILSIPYISSPSQAYEIENQKGNNRRIMVSLGDSYSSGEGIDNFYGYNKEIPERVKDEDWLSHRSQNSWSGKLILNGVSGTMSDHKFDIAKKNYDDANWYFCAASGAVTDNLKDTHQTVDYYKYNPKEPIVSASLFGPAIDYKSYSQNDYPLPLQLSVFNDLSDHNLSADYVTITIGGNDAEFANIVTDAATPHPINPGALNDKLRDIWNKFYNETKDKNGNNISSIRNRIYDAYHNIRDAAGDQAKIIVAGYPKLMKASGTILFDKNDASLINNSVTRFNKEIETIVNSCKSEGTRICFVSVEEEFDKDPDRTWLNYIIPNQSQDINDRKIISNYSMHPNNLGSDAYFRCVQEKINSIEKDGGKSEWPEMTSSDERDVVMVLDASGSMDGTPMEQVVKASEKFVDTVLKEEASIGVVAYDNSSLKVCNFCKNQNYLINSFSKLNAGGGTNIESGLKCAEDMLEQSSAKKKIIVLMSDGMPNDGKTGYDLTEYAKTLREKGIYIYTLGFFSSLYGSEKNGAQDLMKEIAGDESFYFDIDDAENIVYFFGDIADQIRGQKYIYIKVACPVDVTVEYNGETLSSDASNLNKRTSFGSLTLESNSNNNEQDVDFYESNTDLVKILRLKDNADYNVSISGTGSGSMDYTIGFMDDNGEYSDTRHFNDIQINKRTVIDTVAGDMNTTVLNVDEDGDGKYDYLYEASKNGSGVLVERTNTLIIIICIFIILIMGCVSALVIVANVRKKKKNTPQN